MVLRTRYASVNVPSAPSTCAVAKSPTVTPRASEPDLARSCATMSSDSSMPWTGTPRRLRGNARRPVPTPSSSTAPRPARSARKFTAGSTTAGSNRFAHLASNPLATVPTKALCGTDPWCQVRMVGYRARVSPASVRW